MRAYDVKEQASAPEQPAVAVAIITSDLGVLVGKRQDGSPPWTFPGGKIEPGESPEDAAVRETLEETGLRVQVTGVIGKRVHPQSGVTIVYVTAVPAAEADAVAAGYELAEVRWVGLVEATESSLSCLAVHCWTSLRRLLTDFSWRQVSSYSFPRSMFFACNWAGRQCFLVSFYAAMYSVSQCLQ
jgi:8-oxo-dGTP diphosphatase